MIAYALVVWICFTKGQACDAVHAQRVLRSAPMSRYVCMASMPRYARAGRTVRTAVACEAVSPEV